MCAEEWTFVRAAAKGRAKVTMLSAQQAAAYYDPEKSRGAYSTRDAYLADIVDISRREVEELVRLGCTYIQIDGPQYGALLDSKMREGYRQRGSDPEQLIDRCIEMDNAIIEGIPESPSASTSVEATTRASSTLRATTNRLPVSSSGPFSAGSCSSTTTPAQAGSILSVISQKTG